MIYIRPTTATTWTKKLCTQTGSNNAMAINYNELEYGKKFTVIFAMW